MGMQGDKGRNFYFLPCIRNNYDFIYFLKGITGEAGKDGEQGPIGQPGGNLLIYKWKNEWKHFF